MPLRKPLWRLAAAIAVLLPLTAIAGQNEFCEGYYRGYYEGYKRSSGSIFDPAVPLCPLMPRKRPGDPRDDAEHGYEVGWEQGWDEGQRRFN